MKYQKRTVGTFWDKRGLFILSFFGKNCIILIRWAACLWILCLSLIILLIYLIKSFPRSWTKISISLSWSLQPLIILKKGSWLLVELNLQTGFFVPLLFLNNVQISVLPAALPVNPGESYSVTAACGARKEEKPPCQGLKRGKLSVYPYLRNFLPPAKGREVFSVCNRSIFCWRYSAFLNV